MGHVSWFYHDTFTYPATLNDVDNRRFKIFFHAQVWFNRADSRLAPSQWETALQSNAVSHWLGAHLESALSNLHDMIACICHSRDLSILWHGIPALDHWPSTHATRSYCDYTQVRIDPYRKRIRFNVTDKDFHHKDKTLVSLTIISYDRLAVYLYQNDP